MLVYEFVLFQRLGRGRIIRDKARIINSKLVDICSAARAKVINWRVAINYRRKENWTKEGVHFNRRTAKVVGKKIGEFNNSFLG